MAAEKHRVKVKPVVVVLDPCIVAREVPFSFRDINTGEVGTLTIPEPYVGSNPRRPILSTVRPVDGFLGRKVGDVVIFVTPDQERRVIITAIDGCPSEVVLN